MTPREASVAPAPKPGPPEGAKAREQKIVIPLRPTGSLADNPDAQWVEAIRRLALAMFPVLIVLGVLLPALAGRLFWTVAIASLPLFFVLGGYHRWRRICPLAFVAQAPALFGFAGQRRAGPWLRAHGYRLAFGVFIVSLWLRLVATNGDGYALAVFLVVIAGAAFATGLVFTGKTWCNYVCPIFFVEKLYTEPRGLGDTPSSQCERCTACRPACPDINEENSYWKEILLPDKRYAFYAFPGAVLAFYSYFFLQSGTWDYYFDGRWTHEVGLVRTAFLAGTGATTAGFYFWPAVPRAVAAAATLAVGTALSLGLFQSLEGPVAALVRHRDRTIDPSGERHVMFSLAAFAAFLTFYSFAGAPTLRLVSGVPQLFQILVGTMATLFLVRRLGRRQRDFSEEAVARTIVARWPWTDTAPPRNLREALLIHNVRSQMNRGDARTGVLELYKVAVRESLNSGVASRIDIHDFESLRGRLHITESDHERIMSELADEERALASDGVGHASPEKQLQLNGYLAALTAWMDARAATDRELDDTTVARLRDEYAVTAEEHRVVFARLIQQREGVASHVFRAPLAIEDAASALGLLETSQSQVTAFLGRLLKRRWTRTVDAFLQAISASDGVEAVRAELLSADAERRRAAAAQLGSTLSASTAARLAQTLEQAATEGPHDETSMLRSQLASADPYIRATAFYILQSRGAAKPEDVDALKQDDHPLVLETVEQALQIAANQAGAEPSTLEKMIALCSVPLFAGLEPEDLIRLARTSTEVWFTKDEVLCQEGELGDDAYVVLAGEVSFFRRDGDVARLVGVEGAGTCIGELSVLDPAPRASTVIVASVALRTLRLSGPALREAREASPAVSEGIIRLLVQRLRRIGVGTPQTPGEHTGV